MRFALYHPWVYLRSGVERWMVEVVSRSAHDWTVLTHHHEPDATYPEVAALDVRALRPEVPVRRSLVPLARAAATLAAARLPTDGHDGLLVSSEGLGDLVALRARVPAAAYCHTPLKILHDPAARDGVARQSLGRRLALGTVGPAFEAVDRLAWHRYRHVLVNSAETAARVRSARLRPSGPVEVLEPGVDESWFPPVLRAGREPVLLCAGRVMWQKNLELAVETVRVLVDRGVPVRLVVAGMVDVKSRDYEARLRGLAAGLPISFEIAPDDERLRELYATATALLFTARNEDFGMVLLEAMAAGTPVVAVDAGGPRSIVRHGVDGWLEEPTPQAFADRAEEVLRAGRSLAPVRRAAREAAAERTWERHVARLDAVMAGLAGTGRSGQGPGSSASSSWLASDQDLAEREGS